MEEGSWNVKVVVGRFCKIQFVIMVEVIILMECAPFPAGVEEGR